MICPTVGDGDVPKPVVKFLNEFRHGMVGVISTGNRNFGSAFARSGNVISHKTGVPLLHKLELSGTETDVEIVRKIYADCIQQAGQVRSMRCG